MNKKLVMSCQMRIHSATHFGETQPGAPCLTLQVGPRRMIHLFSNMSLLVGKQVGWKDSQIKIPTKG
jgi:hypothetical protein